MPPPTQGGGARAGRAAPKWTRAPRHFEVYRPVRAVSGVCGVCAGFVCDYYTVCVCLCVRVHACAGLVPQGGVGILAARRRQPLSGGRVHPELVGGGVDDEVPLGVVHERGSFARARGAAGRRSAAVEPQALRPPVGGRAHADAGELGDGGQQVEVRGGARGGGAGGGAAPAEQEGDEEPALEDGVLVAARAGGGEAHVVELCVGDSKRPRPLRPVVSRDDDEGLRAEAELVVENGEQVANLKVDHPDRRQVLGERLLEPALSDRVPALGSRTPRRRQLDAHRPSERRPIHRPRREQVAERRRAEHAGRCPAEHFAERPPDRLDETHRRMRRVEPDVGVEGARAGARAQPRHGGADDVRVSRRPLGGGSPRAKGGCSLGRGCSAEGVVHLFPRAVPRRLGRLCGLGRRLELLAVPRVRRLRRLDRLRVPPPCLGRRGRAEQRGLEHRRPEPGSVGAPIGRNGACAQRRRRRSLLLLAPRLLLRLVRLLLEPRPLRRGEVREGELLPVPLPPPPAASPAHRLHPVRPDRRRLLEMPLPEMARLVALMLEEVRHCW
mmetsp:Transcript_6108/g.18243  ORF Transcript_6108/g.18243 Transcript_6108/m.18243 type:complete len:554 (-) Transcript_6108:307-1968(-)